MPKLGPMELVIILVIVVVLFGATRLPQLGRGIGEGLRNLKKGLREGADESTPPSKNETP
ncbi:MAG: twin-arginine translocase TatA/TatE family subunit [Thermoanaerobaculia bacterium]|jgi:sec-independent protein translocase protein TatA|nr:twin-arginine translocase TatA/TatE family subunit [Thermoanaerobaculia bacterium]